MRKLTIGFVMETPGRRPVPSTCFLCISMAEWSILMRDQSGLTLRSVSDNLVGYQGENIAIEKKKKFFVMLMAALI